MTEQARERDSLEPRVNPDNPDPRLACAVLVDVSGSMGPDYQGVAASKEGELPIDKLNRGLERFARALREDALARRRAEVQLVTFGAKGVRTWPEEGFVEGRDFTAPQPSLTASGGTPLCAAILRALDDLEARKAEYNRAGLEYYRPWLFLLTDGAPTDPEKVQREAVRRIQEAQVGKHLVAFPVGVGDNADLTFLDTLTVQVGKIWNRPIQLDEAKFEEMFLWISDSLGRFTGGDTPHGSSDEEIAAKEEQTGGQAPMPLQVEWSA